MNLLTTVYFLQGPLADAKGMFVKDGFVVLSHSLARREIVASAPQLATIHQRLLAEGVIVEQGPQYCFTRDYLFDSPSGAAAVVLARSANG